MSCYSDPASGGRTGEGEQATSDQPPAPAIPERKVRCRVGSRVKRDPCPNEALDDFGVCLHHLKTISDHWADLLASAVEHFPALRQLITDDEPKEKTP